MGGRVIINGGQEIQRRAGESGHHIEMNWHV